MKDVKMIQEKVRLKTLSADRTLLDNQLFSLCFENYLVSHDSLSVNLTGNEFLDFAEMIYAHCCRLKKENDLPVDIPIRKLPRDYGNSYCISMALYHQLAYTHPYPTKTQSKSLERLLTNKGDVSDLMLIKEMAIERTLYGVAEIFDIVITGEGKA